MIYVFLAEGFEETEATAPIDLLRRARLEVQTVGVTGKVVTGSHRIPVTADITVDEMVLDENLQMIVLPGGMPGTLNEEKSKAVQDAIAYCVEHDRYVCAICAAPSILGHLGLLEGKEAICYPGFEKDLKGATISKKAVVQDGKIVTGRGAGVAVLFGLKLIEVLLGKTASDKVRAAIVLDDPA